MKEQIPNSHLGFRVHLSREAEMRESFRSSVFYILYHNLQGLNCGTGSTSVSSWYDQKRYLFPVMTLTMILIVICPLLSDSEIKVSEESRVILLMLSLFTSVTHILSAGKLLLLIAVMGAVSHIIEF